jgi:hypothetical protein
MHFSSFLHILKLDRHLPIATLLCPDIYGSVQSIGRNNRRVGTINSYSTTSKLGESSALEATVGNKHATENDSIEKRTKIE